MKNQIKVIKITSSDLFNNETHDCNAPSCNKDLNSIIRKYINKKNKRGVGRGCLLSPFLARKWSAGPCQMVVDRPRFCPEMGPKWSACPSLKLMIWTLV